MRLARKTLLLVLTVCLLLGTLFSPGWARWTHQDATQDELNELDVFFARPLAIAGGIIGAGFFVIALPYTIHTGTVKKSADMFILNPFRFAFEREFPDEEEFQGREQ